MPRMMNLQNLRKAQGMNRGELAVLVGVSRTAIAKIEDGAIQSPSYDLVMALAAALHVDHAQLFAAPEGASSPDLKPA